MQLHQIDLQVVVKGLRIGINHWKEHAGTANSLNQTTGIFGNKKPAWLQNIMNSFHQLYRPHYNHSYAPPRFHNGIKAELTFDTSYSMQVVDDDGTATVMDLPCPVFQQGEREKEREKQIICIHCLSCSISK